jgi:hypothetical protein
MSFVVPVDTSELSGHLDLIMPCPHGGADLVARCKFGCWLGHSCFQSGRKFANVTFAIPALRELMMHANLGVAPPEGGEENEVEADPIYQEHQNEVGRMTEWLVTDFVERYFDASLSRINGLENALSVARRFDRERGDQAKELAEKVATLTQFLAVGDKEMANLRTSLSLKASQLAESEALSRHLESRVEELEKQRSAQQEELDSLSRTVRDLIARIPMPRPENPI